MGNRSGSQVCSICSSPILQEVNEALDRKEKLRALAQRSGFSRASLSRHNRKCRNRQAIADHKSKFNPLHDLAWTLWPDGSLIRQPIPYNFQGALRTEPSENDVIVRVEYEPPIVKANKQDPCLPVN